MPAVTRNEFIKHNPSIWSMAVAQSGKNAVTKVMLDLDPDLDYHQNLSVFFRGKCAILPKFVTIS